MRTIGRWTLGDCGNGSRLGTIFVSMGLTVIYGLFGALVFHALQHIDGSRHDFGDACVAAGFIGSAAALLHQMLMRRTPFEAIAFGMAAGLLVAGSFAMNHDLWGGHSVSIPWYESLLPGLYVTYRTLVQGRTAAAKSSDPEAAS